MVGKKLAEDEERVEEKTVVNYIRKYIMRLLARVPLDRNMLILVMGIFESFFFLFFFVFCFFIVSVPNSSARKIAVS